MPPPTENISTWFEEYVRSNEPALRAYLRDFVPAGVEVDDVVQEAFLRIVNIKKKVEVDNARGLLFSIARNITRDHLRKKYVSKTVSLGDCGESYDFIGEHNEPAHQLELADEVELMKAAVTMLPRKCRTIFLLRNYENLTHKEIANRLNISVKTVEAQLTIGFKKCKKYLKESGVFRP